MDRLGKGLLGLVAVLVEPLFEHLVEDAIPADEVLTLAVAGLPAERPAHRLAVLLLEEPLQSVA